MIKQYLLESDLHIPSSRIGVAHKRVSRMMKSVWPPCTSLLEQFELAGLIGRETTKALYVTDIADRNQVSERFLHAIAPFVKSNSFLTFMEDEPTYSFYQYRFKNKKCYRRNVEFRGISIAQEHEDAIAIRNAKRCSCGRL